MLQIKLKLLGLFRSCVDESGDDGVRIIALAPGSRLGDALMGAALPVDVPRVVLLNGIQRSDDPELENGDTITVFPPIAGGCPKNAWTH